MSKFTFTLNGSEYEYEAEGLTRVQAAAVAVYDAEVGTTNAERGEALTALLADGNHRTGGTYGNLKVAGLEALGRRGEVTSNGGGGGKVKEGVRVNDWDKLRAEAEALEGETPAEIKPPTFKTWREAETERLTAAVEKAREAVKAFTATPDADLKDRHAEAVEKAKAEAERVRAANVERAAKLREAADEAEAVAAFLAERRGVKA
jgi:hypothetical protein